jgi:hypothetical protein
MTGVEDGSVSLIHPWMSHSSSAHVMGLSSVTKDKNNPLRDVLQWRLFSDLAVSPTVSLTTNITRGYR